VTHSARDKLVCFVVFGLSGVGDEAPGRQAADRRDLLLFFGALAKLRETSITFFMSVRLSVRRHGTTRLPLDGLA
jgi:hypothetical protein